MSLDMESFVLVLFVCSVLIVGSQGDLPDDALIVHPMVLESREPSFEKLLVIHDGHSLKLTKASVLAEKLLLRDITDNGVIDRYVDGKVYENELYQDSEQLASLVVKPQSNGDYHIEGIVNSTHFIRPILTSRRSLSGRTAHQLSRLEERKSTHDIIRTSRRASQRGKRNEETPLELPKNFTIEMVFISGFNHTKYFNNETDRINYVSVLMLGVGLRLQRLDPPGRIALTSIMGCTTTRDENIFVSLSSDGFVLGGPTLTKMSNQVLRIIRAADMVYLATQKSIRLADNSKNTNSTVLGLAGIGGACGKNKVAIGMDKPGTYSGLQTAPHEIGHLLGCNHDGETGSESCSGEEYIMRSHSGGKRHYEWSKCSKEAVKKFLRSSKSKCLHDITNERYHIAVLPNKTVEVVTGINGQEYCQNYFPNYQNVTYFETPETCRIYCKIVDSRNKSSLVGLFAPEGIPCNKDRPEMKCSRGTCWWPKP
uniref:Putative tick salivary metalloprotease n=1 Tax=Rhipicephalus pulchellus TaxID=72859 RepID=L7LQH7_RHIPC